MSLAKVAEVIAQHLPRGFGQVCAVGLLSCAAVVVMEVLGLLSLDRPFLAAALVIAATLFSLWAVRTFEEWRCERARRSAMCARQAELRKVVGSLPASQALVLRVFIELGVDKLAPAALHEALNAILGREISGASLQRNIESLVAHKHLCGSYDLWMPADRFELLSQHPDLVGAKTKPRAVVR